MESGTHGGNADHALRIGFESTPLWRSSLAARQEHDPESAERERLRASYLSLRKNVALLLAELPRSVPSFTVHDITHVDALWETASLVCGNEQPVNPAEAYVLGAAFAFHDAAMGLAAYPDGIADFMGSAAWSDLVAATYVEVEGRWPSTDEIDEVPPEVLEACVSAAVRQTHALRAASLVEQPWELNSGHCLHLIEDVDLRQAYGPLIGELAASHWWSVDRLPRRFRHTRGSQPWQPADWAIEPLKLACILRLADATQIDSRRAPSFLLTLRRGSGLSGLARNHWRFQEHVNRPQLIGDRVSYSASRPFGPDDAGAWWLALDYLRGVDHELKQVDSLLHDLRQQRMTARAVACVDRPERFAELFEVDGWRPVDADVQISDVRALVTALGGEQLYGRLPEVAVRELIQNAQDAVLARRAIDPTYAGGQVDVSLEQDDDGWLLEVSDDGVGMDEDIIIYGLLDFGRSGWRTSTVRTRFTGLSAGGFTPRGRFGLGFFAVFMLADDVSVTTRRFDLGHADGCHLQFYGLERRPLLSSTPAGAANRPGTSVRARLKQDPISRGGLLDRPSTDSLGDLVRRLAPSTVVPIVTSERGHTHGRSLQPFDIGGASPEALFDRLYPRRDRDAAGAEVERVAMRADFGGRATELRSSSGDRLGLAVLGFDFAFWRNYQGRVIVDGFHADEYFFFCGYFMGDPNRASRDNVELIASPEQFATWVESQRQRMRELGSFDVANQLDLAGILHRATGRMDDDHHLAMVSTGLLRLGDIQEWAAGRNEIYVGFGWPLQWQTRPPAVIHHPSGSTVTPPADWIICSQGFYWDPFIERMFPYQGDPNYADHRYDQDRTWQKAWYYSSGWLKGVVIDRICRGWGCEPGDVLAPVAARGWDDYADLAIPGASPAPVWHLRRP